MKTINVDSDAVTEDRRLSSLMLLKMFVITFTSNFVQEKDTETKIGVLRYY